MVHGRKWGVQHDIPVKMTHDPTEGGRDDGKNKAMRDIALLKKRHPAQLKSCQFQENFLKDQCCELREKTR
jgi:hypothetical protein